MGITSGVLLLGGNGGMASLTDGDFPLDFDEDDFRGIAADFFRFDLEDPPCFVLGGVEEATAEERVKRRLTTLKSESELSDPDEELSFVRSSSGGCGPSARTFLGFALLGDGRTSVAPGLRAGSGIPEVGSMVLRPFAAFSLELGSGPFRFLRDLGWSPKALSGEETALIEGAAAHGGGDVDGAAMSTVDKGRISRGSVSRGDDRTGEGGEDAEPDPTAVVSAIVFEL